jgi:hypothetical protein
MLAGPLRTARDTARGAVGATAGVVRHAAWWLRHNLHGAARDAVPPPAAKPPRRGGSDER